MQVEEAPVQFDRAERRSLIPTNRTSGTITVLCCVLVLLALQPGIHRPLRQAVFWAHDFLLYDNLHEVVPGRFFRSGNMQPDELASVIEERGIRTVINLRNRPPQPGDDGITARDVAEANDVAYFHIGFLTSQLPRKDRLLRLLETFERAEKPILVHCTSGAMRTGVASAIWMLHMESASLPSALRQLSPRYGFWPIETWLREREHGMPALTRLFDLYRAPYADHVPFRDWVEAGREVVNTRGIEHFAPAG